jgi:putative membrane protein
MSLDLFAPSRAPLAIDLIAYAMLGLVPLLATSLYLVKKGHYDAHRRIQVSLSVGLLLVIVAFEIEVRLRGWTQWAKASPYFDGILFPFLYGHVTLATVTTVLWAVTIVKAMRGFPAPTRPGPHSIPHKKLARWAAGAMFLTATTGWTFFWMAFVAV